MASSHHQSSVSGSPTKSTEYVAGKLFESLAGRSEINWCSLCRFCGSPIAPCNHQIGLEYVGDWGNCLFIFFVFESCDRLNLILAKSRSFGLEKLIPQKFFVRNYPWQIRFVNVTDFCCSFTRSCCIYGSVVLFVYFTLVPSSLLDTGESVLVFYCFDKLTLGRVWFLSQSLLTARILISHRWIKASECWSKSVYMFVPDEVWAKLLTVTSRRTC